MIDTSRKSYERQYIFKICCYYKKTKQMIDKYYKKT